MSVSEILSMVNALMVQWGIMPYVQASLVLVVVIGAIVGLRRLGVGS